MSTTTHITRITQVYLMNKSKRELADEYLILCDAKDKIQDEHEQLKLRLAQANAALGIVDPALGTGAFLAGLENPPYGEKGGTQATCKWESDIDRETDVWETRCGNAVVFDEGEPKEHGYKFCPYCGKPIEFVIDGGTE